MRDSLTGNLLVASSLVTDPVYSGGVCLIVHQDESDVIGVMLNRPMKPSPDALLKILGQEPTNHRLAAYGLADDIEANPNEANPLQSSEIELADAETTDPLPEDGTEQLDPPPRDTPQDESPLGMLHFGGPRSGPVVAIHQTSEFAEAETGEGVYVAAQKQHLEELVRDNAAPCRLIVGHLGWDPDQLAAEIDAGIWHVVPATAESVFSSAGEMWPRLIRRATSCSMAKWIGVPDLVDAGQLN